LEAEGIASSRKLIKCISIADYRPLEISQFAAFLKRGNLSLQLKLTAKVACVLAKSFAIAARNELVDLRLFKGR
jgi:hypothetical protein